jgi:hypothetical protein
MRARVLRGLGLVKLFYALPCNFMPHTPYPNSAFWKYSENNELKGQ